MELTYNFTNLLYDVAIIAIFWDLSSVMFLFTNTFGSLIFEKGM